MLPTGIENHSTRHERAAINPRRESLLIRRTTHVLGEQSSRERQDGGGEEQQQVEHEQQMVGPPDVMEHGVVVRPHDAHLKKADHERDVDWPFLEERRAQTTAGERVYARYAEIEHEQCDDHGKHTVAERLETAGRRRRLSCRRRGWSSEVFLYRRRRAFHVRVSLGKARRQHRLSPKSYIVLRTLTPWMSDNNL